MARRSRVSGLVEFRLDDSDRVRGVPEGRQALRLATDGNEDIDPLGTLTNQLEYDGITVRLRAHVFVEPQSTHNVRIVIADVNDGVWDSGTFLETNSFRTTIPTP